MDKLNEFKIAFDKIKQIVIDNDPVGLIDGGAPHDEYDDEIFQVVKLISKDFNLDELSNNIYQIFNNHFVGLVNLDKCRKTAELLLIDL